ncbi:FAD-dependent oxidoreductase [Rhizobium lentis]|uniref:FAD-dependent oxidoreductase n=1 Tax=Rhizobium lentis TaxID=1138194 RepID=UPI001C82F33F|nr:FAD-dependent oxidoreductase [Rhizobium lentis]MBX5144958.1 FAD-dependent oxidoreductase [Rhizobium lentis]
MSFHIGPGAAFSLGLAASLRQRRGGLPQLRSYTYETETEALVASFANAPSERRKRTINRAMKRLKRPIDGSSIWAKAKCLMFVGADENASLRWWTDPSRSATKIGSPTFLAGFGWTANANGQALNTGLLGNELDQNDLGAYVYCTSAITGNSNNDMGVLNAASQGISICVRRATNDNQSIRLASAVTTAIAADGDTDGAGLTGASRFDGANVTGSHNGVTKNTVALASVALPALPIYLLAANTNGAPANFSPRRQAFCYVGKGLTPAQETELHAIVAEYLEAVGYGDAYIEEVGVGTQVIDVDFVAYGFEAQSVAAALQHARNGLSVAFVGGWRDRFNFGGMSTGGLGFTDVLNIDAYVGLYRYLLKRIKTIANNPNELTYFEPRHMQWALRELLTFEKNGGYHIPIYQTDGVVSVQKVGTEVKSFTTADGRTFNIKGFIDNSYEMDLARAAGCSYFIGREAAGTGAEANNGVDSSFIEFNGVDPFNTPGDVASGFINQIQASRSAYTPGMNTLPPAGSADALTQAYNFRLTMTNSPRWRRPAPTMPPPGFDIADYEIVLRFMAANPTKTSFTDYFKADNFTGGTPGKYDVNNRPGVPSSDFIGKNWDYPLAAKSVREALWKAHWNWVLGLLWLIQYGTDPRIPAALKTNALQWGFCSDHYPSPHENDTVGMNPQMYVRESIRLNGVAKLTGNELIRGDGGVPSISTNTISMISYFMDSHAFRYIAYEKSPGLWIVASEGGMEVDLGGADGMFPLPLEIATPKPTECTNGFVGFCFSTTHVAFGAARMEPTAIQAGQSLGQVSAEAIKNGRTFQDPANYPAARAALLANAFALTNETAPVLAQTT